MQARLQELLGGHIDKERILQEAAVLVDRSDIQEELVRLNTHVQHFLALLDQGGEPASTFLAGDSAGGGLAVATAIALSWRPRSARSRRSFAPNGVIPGRARAGA